MERIRERRPVPGWFWVGAIASLLFMAMGCLAYLQHVMTDPAALSIDRRAAYQAEPIWVTAANAIAVWAGLAGTVLLLVRSRLADPALLLSVVAVIVWLAGLLLVGGLRENMSTNDFVVAIIVTAITWTIFWFARHSRQRGWLR